MGIEVSISTESGDECLEDAVIVSAYIDPEFPDPHAVFAEVPAVLGDADDEFVQTVREMLGTAAGTVDTVARLAAYADIERYLHHNALVLPLSQSATTITEHVRNDVRGYAPAPYGGSIYSTVWIDDSP